MKMVLLNIFITNRATTVVVLCLLIAMLLSLLSLGHSFPLFIGSRVRSINSNIGRTRRISLATTKLSSSTTTSSSLLSSLSADNTQKSSPQILKFQEPKTNVTVVLVGCMHYNPTSIQLAADTVTKLGAQNKLGSVVIESCDIRWNKTTEFNKDKPYLKTILKSEMSTATDIAMSDSYRRPVVLGDQRINITGSQLVNGFKQTIIDLATPPVGWKRFYDDLKPAFTDAVPSGPGYLDASSFFDFRLLLAMPVSFFKYPLSYLVRSPISTIVFVSILFTLNLLDPTSTTASASSSVSTIGGGLYGTSELQPSDYILSLAFAFVETLVFARILTKELLAERNEILAKNILEQCKIYAINDNDFPKKNTNNNLFGLRMPTLSLPRLGMNDNDDVSTDNDDSEIIYVPNSKIVCSATTNNKKGEKEKTVVAILGLAHCNGIMKLLKEERIQ